jgi:hypothetical protein
MIWFMPIPGRTFVSTKNNVMKVKTIYVADYEKHNLSQYPNFSSTGSIRGMRDKFYGKDALLVRCGAYIYDVSASPEVYEAAH